MEEIFEKACAEHSIPGAVLLAANSSGMHSSLLCCEVHSHLLRGSFKYENVFGSSSLKDLSSKPALKMDDVMWIASCIKLLTSIAALQLVDRGQFTLNDDVGTILPELANLDIITGFKDEKPQLTK